MIPISHEEVMQKVAQGKPYILLMLLSGRELESGEDAATLQMQHLSHLFTLEQQGRASIFGPVLKDEKFRGLIIFNTSSKEDVTLWMADDPYVSKGYLTYELYEFFSIPAQQIANY